jgi:hypothetical protein
MIYPPDLPEIQEPIVVSCNAYITHTIPIHDIAVVLLIEGLIVNAVLRRKTLPGNGRE